MLPITSVGVADLLVYLAQILDPATEHAHYLHQRGAYYVFTVCHKGPDRDRTRLMASLRNLERRSDNSKRT